MIESRVISNFPKKGINFIDMDYTYRNQLPKIIGQLKENMSTTEAIIAIGSRGFITGSILAHDLNLPLYLVRPIAKCPKDCLVIGKVTNEYTSTDEALDLGISFDVTSHKNVTIVDDVLATGNTLNSVINLLESLGVKVVESLVTFKIRHLNPKVNSYLYYVQEVSTDFT